MTENIIPKFSRSELTLGNLLGEGGFSLVFGITRIEVDEVYNLSDELTRIRNDIATEAMISMVDPNYGSSQPRYAVKMLRDDLLDEEYQKGVIDLAVEARLLKRLIHPHIISMKATANSDPLESRFFIILEVLNSTLDDRITEWRQEITKTLSIWCGPLGYCCANKSLLHQLWEERIGVSRDIADALKYCHSQSVIYRDLKPENIGFDELGQCKIFDFGLAKRLYEQDRQEFGLYQLTGNTGSLRYMAPEVAMNQNYNFKADCYSFAIVFWQICSLQIPFAGYNVQMHADLVLNKGYRPKIERSWPFTWSRLMSTCWSSSINERFSFEQIYDILTTELINLKSHLGERSDLDIKAKKKEKEVEGVQLDEDTRKVYEGEIAFMRDKENIKNSSPRTQSNAEIV